MTKTYSDIPERLREYRKRPYVYRLREWAEFGTHGAAAIYLQRNETSGGADYYEVVQLRWYPERQIGDRTIAEGYSLPSSEKWGTYGWTVRTYDQALARFDGLCAKLEAASQEASTPDEPPPSVESAD